MIEALVESGASLETRDGTGNTPLQRAAAANKAPEVLRALLSAGSDVKVRNDDGLTPVHSAARHNGNPAVVQLLAAVEADLDTRGNNRGNETPALPATDDGQLPPEIIIDSRLLRAEQSVRNGDLRNAREAMEEMVALQTEHNVAPVAEHYYRHATVWKAIGAWRQSLVAVRHYLQLVGRGGAHYGDALALMNEATTAIETIDRERADQARRQAERERAVSAAAEVLSRMDFVDIPAGQFQMGKSDVASRRLTNVRISEPFAVGRYEVTQREWESVMGSNPSHFAGCPRCPVEQFTWDEVQRFIAVLNTANGGIWRYRLPTEAEWEYAARAGATGDRYVRDVRASAWCRPYSESRTHAVGLKAPNAFGLHDMLGNVAEVVADWGWRYPGGTLVDPVGPSRPTRVVSTLANPAKVVRGGAWSYPANTCETGPRGGMLMEHPDGGGGMRGRSDIGFRLVRTSLR